MTDRSESQEEQIWRMIQRFVDVQVPDLARQIELASRCRTAIDEGDTFTVFRALNGIQRMQAASAPVRFRAIDGLTHLRHIEAEREDDAAADRQGLLDRLKFESPLTADDEAAAGVAADEIVRIASRKSVRSQGKGDPEGLESADQPESDEAHP